MQVYREIFENFIGEFKAYQPLLSDIKREYDITIEVQIDELDKMESIKSKLAILEFKMAQEIQRVRDEANDSLRDLRLTNLTKN
jgi:Translin-associated factor X-interacting N-terminus